MISIKSLFLFGVLAVTASLVQSADVNQDKLETFSLTRDGFYRQNPDGLVDGFFAAWPAVLFIIAAAFLAIAILGFFGYITGLCRSPDRDQFQTIVA